MSDDHDFLVASKAVEESLAFLWCADRLAKEGNQDDARACLKGVKALASGYDEVLGNRSDDLAGVAEGQIAHHGPGGVLYHASAHDAVRSLRTITDLCVLNSNEIIRPDLLDWLGVDSSRLVAHLRRERAKLSKPDNTVNRTTDNRQSLDARALALLIENPTMTKTKIAKELGLKNWRSLCRVRYPKLNAAIDAYKANFDPGNTLRGSKDADGGLEAWDDDDQ